jgi:MtrB/PioB family decaheme-associated outer membrane protein
MRLKLAVLALVLVLIPCFVAVAEEANFQAEVTVGGTLPYVQGNTAKFNQYGDLKNGTISLLPSDVIANLDNKKGYWMEFKALNPGYEGQAYTLDGGKYGSFKYNAYFKQIPHNIQWNAVTPFSGAGYGGNTYNYVGTGADQVPSSNTATWNIIDYSILRNQFGANLSVDHLKPFFFNVGYTYESKNGTTFGGADGGTGSPSGATELPLPIEYVSQSFNVEAGYGKNPFFLALSYQWQQFRNDNEFLYFRNPFKGIASVVNPDVYTLPPDNDFQKLAFKGNVKLPYNTVFDAKGAWSQATSSSTLLTSGYGTAGAATGPSVLTPNQSNFDGQRDIQNYDFMLTSRPWSFFDGRIYYKYYQTKNKSDEVTYTDQSTGATSTNLLFDYWYWNAGADVNWRLAKGVTLFTGYKYQYQSQEREDIPTDKDNYYDISLRYSGLDWMSAKFGYQYFTRNGDHPGVNVPATDDLFIENYVYRYDLASQNRSTYKFDVTFSPIDTFNFTTGYRYAYVNYKDTVFGYEDVKTQAVKLDADYTFKYARLYGYFDYEWSDMNQTQRRFNPGNASPTTAPSTNDYNWSLKQSFDSYDFGAMADVPIIPKKLTLRLQADYLRNNGYADYTYLNGVGLTGGRNNDNIDMAQWDDYYMQRYMIKATYMFTPKFSVTGGYAYQQFRYNDAQTNDYRLVMPLTGTPNTYLTGLGSRQSYLANIYFLSMAYKF